MKMMPGREALGRTCWGLLLLLLLTEVAHSSRVTRQAATGDAACAAGSRCVPFSGCTQLHSLLRPPTRSSISRLRRLSCGRLNTRTQICCPGVPNLSLPDDGPGTRGVTPTTPRPTIRPSPVASAPTAPTSAASGEDLLPTQCGNTIVSDKVHGGAPADLGAYPWMAVLGFTRPGRPRPSWGCGGTLITDRYVLTAVHCTVRAITNYMDLTVVRLGENNLATDPDCTSGHRLRQTCAFRVQDYGIERVTRHPDYNKRSRLSDDVALLRLDRRVQMNPYVSPICLPPAGATIQSIMAGRDKVIVTGWGDTEANVRSMQLLQVELPIVSYDVCRAAADYNQTLVKDGHGQVCFGGIFQQDSCLKDSGGPAVITSRIGGPPYVQVGLVSYGSPDCGVEGVPGVYADITTYRQWIVGNIRP